MLYWTEWGKVPAVMRMSIQGQGGQDSISSVMSASDTELSKPNGLFLNTEAQELYVADGDLNTVFKCNLQGEPCCVQEGLPKIHILIVLDLSLFATCNIALALFLVGVDVSAEGGDADCATLTYITNVPRHMYSISVVNIVLLYSDWLSKSIGGVSMLTGKSVDDVMQGLMRPSQFYVKLQQTAGEKKSARPELFRLLVRS